MAAYSRDKIQTENFPPSQCSTHHIVVVQGLDFALEMTPLGFPTNPLSCIFGSPSLTPKKNKDLPRCHLKKEIGGVGMTQQVRKSFSSAGILLKAKCFPIFFKEEDGGFTGINYK